MNEQEILDFLADLAHSDQVREDPDTSLFSSGLLDSISAVELLAFLEERSGLAISPSEIDWDRFDTPAQIVAFVAQKQPSAV